MNETLLRGETAKVSANSDECPTSKHHMYFVARGKLEHVRAELKL